MNTFFLLQIEGQHPLALRSFTKTLGIYTSFQEASSIMLDHMPSILLCEGLCFKDYRVTITEVMIEDNKWLPVRLRAEERSKMI